MFEIQSINNPHDLIFKTSMQNISVAHDFFESYLPYEVREKADLRTLGLVNKSFIDETMKEMHSDLIYSVQVHGELAYLYLLLEHQSSPDPLMPWRLLEYKVRLIRQHLNQGNDSPPSVISMFVYCGKQSPYPYSMVFSDLYGHPHFQEDRIVNKCHIIDFTAIPDEQLDQTRNAAFISYLLKLAYSRDQLRQWGKILVKEPCRIWLLQCDSIYHEQMLKYLLNILRDVKEVSLREVFAMYTESFPEKKDEAMSTLGYWEKKHYLEGMQQGIEQGVEQGREDERCKIIMNLLNHGLSAENVAEYTGFSITEIQSIVGDKAE